MDSLLNFDDLQNRLFIDNNNNNHFDDSPAALKEDKYSLRPRSVRRITEKSKSTNLEEVENRSSLTKGRQNKTKAKTAPLSKYRRKTANARERNRMREINQAFESLRRVIPHMQVPAQASPTNEKLTKITTLRLAMKYINALSSALSSPMNNSIDYSDLECLLLESDGESLSMSDHSSGSLLASPDFPETSLSPVNFDDPTFLHTDFTDHDALELEGTDLSEFLLT